MNVKHSLEKKYMAEYGACEARVRLFRAELEEIHGRIERDRLDFRRTATAGAKAPKLAAFSAGFAALREKANAQLRKIEAAEEEKQRVQAALFKVMQERKMLEKLKEKQIEEYKMIQKAEEAAETDEFLTNKLYTSK